MPLRDHGLPSQYLVCPPMADLGIPGIDKELVPRPILDGDQCNLRGFRANANGCSGEVMDQMFGNPQKLKILRGTLNFGPQT